MKSLNKLCIGFYGTSEFSLSFLKELFSQNIKISYIVTKPPIPSGRGKKVNISPVHEWGLKNKIDVLTPADMKDRKFLDYVKKRKIDFNIIVAYGNILTKEIINIPDYLSINVHASLLPRWRGAAPIQRAILSDDKETGVCIMRLDEKLDSGPIITLQKIVIEDDDNCENVYKKIVFFGKKILRDAIFKIINDDVNYVYQDERFVTYAEKIKKNEVQINWEKDAHEINQKIKAFSPKPGAWTIIRNSDTRIKILKANIIKEKDYQKKDKLKIGGVDEDLEVRCGKDFLKIKILQRNGKKPISAVDFLNGNKISISEFC